MQHVCTSDWQAALRVVLAKLKWPLSWHFLAGTIEHVNPWNNYPADRHATGWLALQPVAADQTTALTDEMMTAGRSSKSSAISVWQHSAA